MKKSIVLVASFLFTICIQAQIWGNKKIKGNGNISTITRTTSDYEGIKCSGWMDFVLVKGTEGKIKIEGEKNLLQYIITEVIDNQLIIKTQKNVDLQPSRNETIKITIPYEIIDSVSLSGSGDVNAIDVINSDNFYINLTGSGDIDLGIKAQSIETSITGSGDITLVGKTDEFTGTVTGSGSFNGFKLQANMVDAKITGSGDMEINVSKELKARVLGSGDIEYKGTPLREDIKVIGSGTITN